MSPTVIWLITCVIGLAAAVWLLIESLIHAKQSKRERLWLIVPEQYGKAISAVLIGARMILAGAIAVLVLTENPHVREWFVPLLSAGNVLTTLGLLALIAASFWPVRDTNGTS